MKRRNVLGLLLIIASAFLLTGCGTELVELTAAERQQIINYSAHVVSEFNMRQEKGYIVLSAETLEALDNKNKEDAGETEKEPDNNADDKTPDSGKEDTDKGTGDNNSGESQATSTLTEALGIAGIQAEIQSYSIEDNYSESDISNVNAGTGNRLVVVRCLLTNTTETPVLCDIFNGEYEFYLSINDGKNKAASLMTILNKDLTTMTAELAANETKEMVILFPVPIDIANSMDSVKLIVKNASTNHTISMN